MTPDEQVRAKGLAVLTGAVAQGQYNRNTDRMLAKMHACRDYSAPAGTRVPPGNLQDNPDYKGAYTALFELPDRYSVDMSTVEAISQGLIVSYEAVRFYEQALLKVEQQLFEQTETEARLHEEMYKVDELSSIVQAQDEHKLRLEEARINAENAQYAVTEDLKRRLYEAEEANRETSRKLEKEKQEQISISRLLENRDNQMSAEISDLTISRQEAVLQHEFACTQHSDDNYHQLADELSSEQPADREVHIADFVTIKNRLWSAESELNRAVSQLEESQESRRGLRQNLAQLQERYVTLDREKNELTMRLAYIQGATQAARELLEEERLEQEELHAEVQAETAWSRLQSDRLRSQETQTGAHTSSQSSAQGSYLLIGNSQAAPATTSTIRNELDEPGDEAIQ